MMIRGVDEHRFVELAIRCVVGPEISHDERQELEVFFGEEENRLWFNRQSHEAVPLLYGVSGLECMAFGPNIVLSGRCEGGWFATHLNIDISVSDAAHRLYALSALEPEVIMWLKPELATLDTHLKLLIERFVSRHGLVEIKQGFQELSRLIAAK